eukprot:TRINITY_DN2083_c0_g1_i1.p1 TRINITY_DN2083_c0_g1~~TRINITY_DN2083_c0_g1_i1.p1  ORF type:complete len:117 (-),score=10.52 TRINITY_DN2083_c0_g1_i1:76-426(-)
MVYQVPDIPEEKKAAPDNTGLIVGVVVGVVVSLAIAGGIVWYCKAQKAKRNKVQPHTVQVSSTPTPGEYPQPTYVMTTAQPQQVVYTTGTPVGGYPMQPVVYTNQPPQVVVHNGPY